MTDNTAADERWFFNSFRNRIVEGLEEQDAHRSVQPLRHRRRAWVCDSLDGLASAPALLQGRRLIVEATDRGFLLMPPGKHERFALDIVLSDPAGGALTPASVEIAPGSITRRFRESSATLTAAVDLELPILVVQLERPAEMQLSAALRFVPAAAAVLSEGLLWLRPAEAPLVRPDLCHNNSRVPDPPAPKDGERFGVAACLMVGASGENRSLTYTIDDSCRSSTPVLLVDQPAEGSQDIAVTLPPDSKAAFVFVVAPTADVARQVLDRWVTAPRGDWTALLDRLVVDVPDDAITRQVRFSLHNSLACRATGTGDRDIFVHGRRDRGYADVAHLHQSYMLHFPALASGETGSVRDEILAFLELQDDEGGLQLAPRPIKGAHPYVGTYTNAHLPLALHRYLAWSGDRSILTEKVAGATVLERTRLACAWLLDRRHDGCIMPCGWLDAWPPDVRAQAQTSIAAIMGLRAFDHIERLVGNEASLASEAGLVADAVRRVFWNETSGIFAENLLADGTVKGDSESDFFAHTQIWATLAGIAPDPRGLDLVRSRCFDRGVFAVPASAMESSYLRDSTDGTDELSIESTATWLLARWPELTHLYALAEIEAGRPDRALEAVLEQLPETLHRTYPKCLPYLYPEKFLAPGTVPWLCTWAGDPTLVEVVLSGFAGVRPELDGLSIRPLLPAAWTGKELTFDFKWAAGRWQLKFSPTLDPGTLIVDGANLPADSRLHPTPGSHSIVMSSLAAGTRLPTVRL